MFCQYCGKQIDDGSRFCDYCGKPQLGASASSVKPVANPANTVQQQKQGLGIGTKVAIAIMAIAIVGIVIAVIVAFALPKADEVSDDAAATRQDSNVSHGAATTTEGASGGASKPPSKQTVVPLKSAGKGDLVEYGQYHQSSSSSKEGIEWIVLEVKDGHALLLSAKALDCRPISSSISTSFDVTWEKSDIRDWLNGNFLGAFTEAEANGIDTIDVEQSNSADGKTQDKVFLLSESEFTTYISDDWAKAKATEYAQEQGAKTFDDQGTTNWWLRDYNPNRQTTTDDNNFLNVFYDGTVNPLGYRATDSGIAIRPAMWVSLDGKGVSIGESQSDGKEKPQSTSANSEPSVDDIVTLTVKAADGATLSGTVKRNDNGFVIADSSSKEYSINELKALNLSDAELCIAWNEPFARQGYHFKNPDLLAYFQACDWYVDTGNTSNLTGVSAVNNERLRQIAEENASSKRWENLATS